MGLRHSFLINLRVHVRCLHEGTVQVSPFQIPKQPSITETDVFLLVFPKLLKPERLWFPLGEQQGSVPISCSKKEAGNSK